MILDQFKLDGKVAIVTGSARGIGQAYAIALAEAGADIALAVISATAGIEVNTRRLFKAAQDAKLSVAIVINKIDGENVNLDRLLKDIAETFGPDANVPGPCTPMVSYGHANCLGVELAFHHRVVGNILTYPFD